jgi:DMSO/TMAO reductase YedYZ molybdopterin-dependent catalytic subunit
LDAWTFALEAEDGTKIVSWSWEEFRALGPTEVTVDVHCVTHWSTFDTDWYRPAGGSGAAERPRWSR